MFTVTIVETEKELLSLKSCYVPEESIRNVTGNADSIKSVNGLIEFHWR